MKTIRPWYWMHLLLVSGTFLALAAAGCRDSRLSDFQAPAAPRGVYSVTGDHSVTLYWEANTERDLRGYYVYYSIQGATGPYKQLAFTTHTTWLDTDVQNGSTYWYAVTAVDDNGNESELSAENVHDTPRPEGFGLRVFNAALADARGGSYQSANGLNFQTFQSVDYRDGHADVYYLASGGHHRLYPGDSHTGLQDAGFTSGGLDDVDFAPAGGWLFATPVELVEGHSYVVWTADNHYAKLYIRSISDDSVLMDWAYQVDRGNRELKAQPPAGSRPRAQEAAAGAATGGRVS